MITLTVLELKERAGIPGRDTDQVLWVLAEMAPRMTIDTRSRTPEAWTVTFQDDDAFEAFREASKYFVPTKRENQVTRCRRLFGSDPGAQPVS